MSSIRVKDRTRRGRDRRTSSVHRLLLQSATTACLVANLASAQTGGDPSRFAPRLGADSATSDLQLQRGDLAADRIAQNGSDAAANRLPEDWIAWPKLSQADLRRSELLSGDAGDGADKPTIKFGGFLDGLPAYTYASPTHWSRAVARLQLTAQGEFADQVKWKLGARVDVDPVYYWSNFYLEPVKKNQRLDVFYRENYLDFSAGDWDFRLGAQQIVWGEVVGLFFADVVSALDEREFLLPSFDIIRIPQVAARAEYTAGDSHLELVWIPIPAFDNIGKPGADFYPVPLPSPTPSQVATLFQDPVKPGHQLSNSSYGVRANTLAAGWDFAAFYYRSLSRTPTFYTLPSDIAGQAVTFQPRYDRIWQVGGTLTKDFSDFVLSRGSRLHAWSGVQRYRSWHAGRGRCPSNTRLHPQRRMDAARGHTRKRAGLSAGVLWRERGGLRGQERWLRREPVRVDQIDEHARAANLVDKEFQGRGRTRSAAAQLVSREEHDARLRCGRFHRADRRILRAF